LSASNVHVFVPSFPFRNAFIQRVNPESHQERLKTLVFVKMFGCACVKTVKMCETLLDRGFRKLSSLIFHTLLPHIRRTEVIAGYRLPCPPNCPTEVYTIMLNCWERVRCLFSKILYVLPFRVDSIENYKLTHLLYHIAHNRTPSSARVSSRS
jgi:hypothetical protein